MFKNTAGQLITVYAYTASTGLPLTGDAANITCTTIKDGGTPAALTTNTATELNNSLRKGYYTFPVSQGETNGDILDFFPQSSTSGIVVVASPPRVFTRPAAFGLVAGAANGLTIAGSNAATTFATLTVSGAMTLAAVSLTTLTASGAVALQSTVTITGAVTFSSTWTITGTITGVFNAGTWR